MLYSSLRKAILYSNVKTGEFLETDLQQESVSQNNQNRLRVAIGSSLIWTFNEYNENNKSKSMLIQLRGLSRN